MGVIDRLEEWVRTKGLFDTQEQRETVLGVITEGREVYETIIDRAHRLGRVSP
jgi:hypothetical protein